MTTLLWRLLLILLVLGVPFAFAADVKISALPAATTVSNNDEFPANQAGTTRKVTIGQAARTRIAGSSGAAGLTETWQVLTADCAANSTTTLAVCMTTTGLPAGSWLFEYHVGWTSATTTVGANFAVNSTATVTSFVASRRYNSTGTAAASGVSDGVAAILTGQLVEHMSTRTNNGSMGPNTGVDTANSAEYDIIRGLVTTTTTGDLELKHASENATSTQVRAPTTLILRKIN